MMILASYWVGTYFLLGFGSIELELCLTYAFLLCIHFINILSKLYNEIYIYSWSHQFTGTLSKYLLRNPTNTFLSFYLSTFVIQALNSLKSIILVYFCFPAKNSLKISWSYSSLAYMIRLNPWQRATKAVK